LEREEEIFIGVISSIHQLQGISTSRGTTWCCSRERVHPGGGSYVRTKVNRLGSRHRWKEVKD
jgi:hypothetical protein